ncbi:MAG: hypothetical protein U5K43_07180 [Halofilum sp. (in: g-proteobacteria)]|nr:hypothetical protein [Halofilum sp. (in: g-proteobacteria)]
MERTIIDASGFHLTVRGGGSGPMRIAQVQVDGAYWRFEQVPAGPVARGETVRIDIPFPWVRGEPHEIRLFTADGTTFEHEIERGRRRASRLGGWAAMRWCGLFVGVLPVALGHGLLPGAAPGGHARSRLRAGADAGPAGLPARRHAPWRRSSRPGGRRRCSRAACSYG